MSRRPDPTSPYRIKIHKDKGYRYAATQPGTVNPATGKKEYRFLHWGTVDENLRFHPGTRYLLATGEERAKLIFPEEWDLSETVALPGLCDTSVKIPEGQSENRLYGDSWLLMEIAKITGVFEDLCTVFKDSINYVNIILTIAFYLIIEKDTYHNIENWYKIYKVPYDKRMNASFITEFTQKITEKNRIDFFACRAKRLDDGEVCAVDSTSRSSWGHSLADIRFGHNKDHLPLPQTNEIVVYTLDKHGPVYYRTCPGNMTDSRSLRLIIKELRDAGFKRLLLITDRGYETIANLEFLISEGQQMILATKLYQNFVLKRIEKFGEFSHHPSTMKLDIKEKIYYQQFDIDYKEINKKSEVVSDRLKLNIYLDPIERAEKISEIDVEIEKQKASLESKKSEQCPLGDDESINEEYSYYDIDYDKNERTINDYTLKNSKYERQIKTAGFFANTTHKVDYDPITAHNHYQLRDEQEKYFSIMKTNLGEDRQRVWSEDAKIGRTFVLFVTQILSCYLSYIRKTKLQKFTSAKKILLEMKSIRFIEHPNSKAMITPFVGKQIEICDAFGFSIPEGCAPSCATETGGEKKGGRSLKEQETPS